jgi:UDP:flavonoid glycosyltransferase YjiC (YdhE family)
LKDLPHSRPVVYVTIGGGAGPVGNHLFFDTIAQALGDRDMEVVVSTSHAFAQYRPRRSSRNVRYFSWVPGRQMIDRADLTIFHGGYGTMMETIACGKPSLTTPFHTEQESNGRRLEQLGCSRVIRLSREEYRRVTGRWNGSLFNYFVQHDYDLTPEALLQAVQDMLEDASRVERARLLMRASGGYGGAEQVLHIITQTI